jgi:hypothetical protein
MPYGLFVPDVGDRLDRSMIFAIISMIYAGTILCLRGDNSADPASLGAKALCGQEP